MQRLQGIIESLKELQEDNTLPKNVREKINSIINVLNEKSEVSLKVDKALHELEGISEDSNLQSYTKTQIWGIVSMLEMVK